jgi:hypothetical protein
MNTADRIGGITVCDFANRDGEVIKLFSWFMPDQIVQMGFKFVMVHLHACFDIEFWVNPCRSFSTAACSSGLTALRKSLNSLWAWRSKGRLYLSAAQ